MFGIINKIIWSVLSFVLMVAIFVFSINIYVLDTGGNKVVDDINEAEYSVIVTFGASVYGNRVSPVLAKRLDKVYEVYTKKNVGKIIVSGDHQSNDYNEVKAMKDYLVKKGIPEGIISMDHSGIDTYHSVCGLKKQAADESFMFITQEEHLKRALYYAEKTGVDAVGIMCDNYESTEYEFQKKREFLARMKAFVLCDLFDGEVNKYNSTIEKLKVVFNEIDSTID